MKKVINVLFSLSIIAIAGMVGISGISVFGAGAADAASYFVETNVRTGDVKPLPYAAMCTVHAYNAGLQANPPLGAEREEMNRIVALKSELITREMKKQYDYLDATVKRFQIQLKKAVLTAQLAAAGAETERQSGGMVQSVYENCGAKNKDETIRCLRANMAKYQNSIAMKSIPKPMRDQILKDAQLIDLFYKTEPTDTPAAKQCTNISMQSADACINAINAKIVNWENAVTAKEKSSKD